MTDADDVQLVAAMVLAAGASSRMGFPKALARIDDEDLLHRALRLCSTVGCAPLIVVLGADAERIVATLEPGRAVVVRNVRPELGQSESIRRGLDAVPSGSGLCLLPVDHAHVREATVQALFHRYSARSGAEQIVVPSLEGRRGHPAFFAPAAVDELRALGVGDAARSVVRRRAERVVHVVTEDPAVVADLDTPEDLRWFGGLPPREAP
jgi:nicotine blue oxidoreductase